MSFCCVCCVLSGRGLCDELITRPEYSYRLWRVVGVITKQKTHKYISVSITYHGNIELGITDIVNVSLVSINVRRLAGDSLNITCNFLYCNHQVHREFLIIV
jgi:hypothetical protein